MAEKIRYSWGMSSLGDFMAASSDKGLVAFEFGDQRTALLDALAVQFPDAVIEEDSVGMSEMVGKLEAVVDNPSLDPGIELDMRGSDFQKLVWERLKEIVAGETTSYGALAASMGIRDARDVTAAIASNTIAILVPCHRVLKKDGSISGYRWGVKRKRALLEREGVSVGR